ncbi:hypothetical protein NQ318_004904 [Aromia moschata]|uniref:Major facilitator superfamily (MFS) profile domain-containing protein n=1 Tax=Aromia moschata TaxID=1265417 RepID=A0AAV8Z094_9CUCU|nr:hypothetical protein NQ318_004904 [Aromia moschata]
MKVNDAPATEDRPPTGWKLQGKESILSSQVNLYVKEAKPSIPDGGWGWFVVLAGFSLNMISEGVTLTFGLLYVEFLNEFQASKSATSWIGSLFMAVPLLVGPLASALVDKYGCKYMTIAGGVITSLGFLTSAYARSIGVMYVTFGIIGGVGRGLTYVTAVVAVAFWFEKRRSVAVGIAQSGAGFGTIIFSPLTTVLLSTYGWRGTLLITASIFLNMCVCGMLMRDPDWIVEEEQKEKEGKKKNDSNSVSKGARKLEPLPELEESQGLLQDINALENSTKDKFRSMVHLPTYLKGNEKVPDEVYKQLSENKELYSMIVSNNSKLLTGRSMSDKSLDASTNEPKKHSIIRGKSREHDQTTISKICEVEEEGEKHKEHQSIHKTHSHKGKSHTHHSYLKHLKHKRHSIGHKSAMLYMSKHRIRASSCPNIYGHASLSAEKEEEEKWYDEFLDILKELTHFSLFLELHFLLLCSSTIVLFTWFIVPYFCLAEHMTRIGYTENQASFILSAIGFTNTVGMVALGWIGDKLNVAKTYAVCLILCGMSIISMMYFTDSYVMLVINCGLFGLMFASCFALTPSLLAQLVPLDHFTMAYGMELLCEGIGNLMGPPLAGLLFDLTQSWSMSFYQAGFWIIGSGILIGVIPYTKNRRIIGTTPLLRDQNKKRHQVSK